MLVYTFTYYEIRGDEVFPRTFSFPETITKSISAQDITPPNTGIASVIIVAQLPDGCIPLLIIPAITGEEFLTVRNMLQDAKTREVSHGGIVASLRGSNYSTCESYDLISAQRPRLEDLGYRVPTPAPG